MICPLADLRRQKHDVLIPKSVRRLEQDIPKERERQVSGSDPVTKTVISNSEEVTRTVGV